MPPEDDMVVEVKVGNVDCLPATATIQVAPGISHCCRRCEAVSTARTFSCSTRAEPGVVSCITTSNVESRSGAKRYLMAGYK